MASDAAAPPEPARSVEPIAFADVAPAPLPAAPELFPAPRRTALDGNSDVNVDIERVAFGSRLVRGARLLAAADESELRSVMMPLIEGALDAGRPGAAASDLRAYIAYMVEQRQESAALDLLTELEHTYPVLREQPDLIGSWEIVRDRAATLGAEPTRRLELANGITAGIAALEATGDNAAAARRSRLAASAWRVAFDPFDAWQEAQRHAEREGKRKDPPQLLPAADLEFMWLPAATQINRTTGEWFTPEDEKALFKRQQEGIARGTADEYLARMMKNRTEDRVNWEPLAHGRLVAMQWDINPMRRPIVDLHADAIVQRGIEFLEQQGVEHDRSDIDHADHRALTRFYERVEERHRSDMRHVALADIAAQRTVHHLDAHIRQSLAVGRVRPVTQEDGTTREVPFTEQDFALVAEYALRYAKLIDTNSEIREALLKTAAAHEAVAAQHAFEARSLLGTTAADSLQAAQDLSAHDLTGAVAALDHTLGLEPYDPDTAAKARRLAGEWHHAAMSDAKTAFEEHRLDEAKQWLRMARALESRAPDRHGTAARALVMLRDSYGVDVSDVPDLPPAPTTGRVTAPSGRNRPPAVSAER